MCKCVALAESLGYVPDPDRESYLLPRASYIFDKCPNLEYIIMTLGDRGLLLAERTLPADDRRFTQLSAPRIDIFVNTSGEEMRDNYNCA